MRLIKPDTSIDFVAYAKYALVFSALLIVVSIVSFSMEKLTFGIDFTGGVIVEVGYPEAVELQNVRDALAEGEFPDATVQHFGASDSVMIRLAPEEGADSSDVSTRVMNALDVEDSAAELRRVEFVGPQVGDELVNKGGLALLYTVIAILIYVIVRFHWKLAAGAVAALVHDITITLGVFSLFHLDFDLTVLAALLAVLGYSLNDTIVVFDRIRENFRRMRKATPVEVVNASVNQTLARTLMTSGTTILTLLALFFLGGEVIHGFATALLIGIVIGTFSSIFVASVLALKLEVTSQDLFPPREEDAEKASRVTR
ncbi:protein translocase subunit SecF [Salinisphaera orenii]|uniref:Protein-export membrane protein SecF n=1 Tax=Salinisphaera orenii YIM 95161 TaxID=1051139 RepID=A0A423Q416_9GAMM|nr:protein translocase subunit SecF [Salinisphaera halophila]ROO33637.1 preprotein translocase subunit SecF [Salinisphaera halophila YIM 95161]